MALVRPLVPLLMIGMVLALLACNGPGATGGLVASPTAAVTVSPTLDLPTAAPTITAAPTAEPFALASGWWDGAVCYEVFVRSFYDSDGDGIGDIPGLIAKLDYINDGDPTTETDLGATCIWLMPIAESPSYHGYDVADYYTVDQEYGTNDDFKRLIEEAHKRGIRVILDLVLNHTSREHPWFQEALRDPNSPYRDWYLWSNDKPRYRGPWGQEVWHASPGGDDYYYGIFWGGMPDLNYRNPAVTAEAQKITAFWLNEMGADGFRLDAIKHLIENTQVQENTQETYAWLREYRTFIAQTKLDAFTIGEIFGGNASNLASYYPDQLDSYFQFDVGEKLIAAANVGQAAPFVQAIELANTRLPYQRWAPFLTNHDQNRVMTVLGGDLSKMKIAAIALLTLPGLPFIYYGEEIGMVGSKPDERIRTPMQWAAEETGGGFTSARPWQPFQADYLEVNVAAQDADPDSLLNLYRRMVRLHSGHPALAQGDFIALKSSSPTVAAFLRHSDVETVLVLLNFGADDADKVMLTLEASDLPAGSYALEPLLGDAPGATLTVGDDGAFADFVPLPSLAGRTGAIFLLEADEQ
jgi:glycosidase